MDYQGKKALIFGMGVSGKACAEYLSRRGATVIGVDKNPALGILGEQELLPWEEIDLCVKSPGIPPNHLLVKEAVRRSLPIFSEIELGLRHLARRNALLFGITGSNGKTTTTLLTTHILQTCGKKALAVGNVGVPLLSMVEADAEVFVIELSSFQTEALACPVLDAAVILNITPNHLDRYGSLEEYALAKLAIEKSLKSTASLYLQEDVEKSYQSYLTKQAESFPTLHEKIASFSQVSYRGGGAPHDEENFRAALALCRILGISEQEAREASRSFCKPPHRIEHVGEVRGIVFVNDSKATSIDAVSKALTSVGGEIILIAGGHDKGGSFQELIPFVQKKVKKILAIGETAGRIQRELESFVSVEIMETLDLAVKKAWQIATAGDTVLLSPGCSSYDQFKDYQERGDLFKHLVSELGKEGKIS